MSEVDDTDGDVIYTRTPGMIETPDYAHITRRRRAVLDVKDIKHDNDVSSTSPLRPSLVRGVASGKGVYRVVGRSE